MKRVLTTLLAVMLVAAVCATGAIATFGPDYPASVGMGYPAPAEGAIMLGTLIGAEEGWGGYEGRGRTAAFDGDPFTFFDPAGAHDPSETIGMMMGEAYILTEIRILPRDGYTGRFEGAAIWGFNGDTFDPNTATLIWESFDPAEEQTWQIIPAARFNADTNTGWTSFMYFNEIQHGDIAELEFWGHPAAQPEPEAEPAPAAAEEAPPAEAAPAAPAPAVTAPTPAPRTADPITLVAIGAVVSAAGVMIAKKRRK